MSRSENVGRVVLEAPSLPPPSPESADMRHTSVLGTRRDVLLGGGIRRKDKLKKMVVGCETENAFKMTSESATW